MHRLHLIVDLPIPLEAAVEQMPGLRRLLARAGGGEPVEEAQALCRVLGIGRQQDWPLAAVLAAAGGHSVDGYWLCASPVAYDIGMNGLLLRAPQPPLDLCQAQALAAALAPELAPLAASLWVTEAQHWLLQLPHRPRLTTHPLAAALDQSVPAGWLEGEDAEQFLRFANSLQMALHQHPLNREREQADQLPINGLWLWGGGEAVEVAARPGQLWGVGPRAQLLARLLHLPAQPLPTRLPRSDAESVWAVLDGLSPAELDANWFEPLASALRWRRVRHLVVALIGRQGRRFELASRNFWPW
jgi:hypothetical protein